MARVLMAWELGGGPGPLGRLGAVASALATAGHEPIFVIRDLIQPAAFLRRHGFVAYQAPAWRSTLAGRVRPTQIAGYADMLASAGFSDGARIAAIVGAWDALIGYLKPDLAVADGGPALMLAARGHFPVVALGDVFSLPPGEADEFPSLLPMVRPVLAQDRMLEMINGALDARNAPALARLPDMMRSHAGFVLGLSLLDPYAALRHDPAIGPIEPLPGVAGPASGRRVFAALDAAFPGVRTLMDGFVRSDLPTLVYMRGVSPDARRKYQNRNIHVVDTPPPSAVADAAIVVHHGSADGTVHALAAGRSQFIVPTGLESHLTGQMLRKLGVGDTIPIKDSAEHIGEALVAMSTDRAVSERALALSAEIERPAPGAVLGRIVDGCRAVLDTVTV